MIGRKSAATWLRNCPGWVTNRGLLDPVACDRVAREVVEPRPPLSSCPLFGTVSRAGSRRGPRDRYGGLAGRPGHLPASGVRRHSSSPLPPAEPESRSGLGSQPACPLTDADSHRRRHRDESAAEPGRRDGAPTTDLRGPSLRFCRPRRTEDEPAGMTANPGVRNRPRGVARPAIGPEKGSPDSTLTR